MTRKYEEGDTITLVLDDHTASTLRLHDRKDGYEYLLARQITLNPELITEHKKADVITKELYLGKDGFRDTYVNKTHAGEKLKKVILSYIPLLNKFNVEIK